MPPSGRRQQELATKRFWEGREIFLVIDGITSWGNTQQTRWSQLVPYIEQGEGPRTAHRGNGRHRAIRSFQSLGRGSSASVMGMQSPVLTLNGHRSHGAVVPGVFAEPQREGKGKLITRRGIQGVLVGWSEPPVLPRRR